MCIRDSDLDLDIRDRRVVAERVREVSPDLVVNAAAYTDVDGAESDELEAFRVNALGAQNLALACRPGDIPLLHVSTDFVFSGEGAVPLTEFDRPEPRGVYGRSKYCLLYTSDAADDLLCVDLGGRRIIKKKKKQQIKEKQKK